VYDNKIEVEDQVELEVSPRLQVDLVTAALAAGVPPVARDIVSAEVSASLQRQYKRNAKMMGSYQVYQIRPEIIRELEDGSDRMQSCRALLAASGHKMYMAVSGLNIVSSESESTTEDKLVADLSAALKAKSIPGAGDLGSLDVKLKAAATQKIRTASAPYFVVIGTSVFDNQRLR